MEPQATPVPPIPPVPTPTMPDSYDQDTQASPTTNIPPAPEPVQPPIQPTPVPEQPNNKMSQKLLVPAIILLVVAIVLVTIKLIFKNKVTTPPQPSPTASTQPTPSPTPDPTADWKTYTNTSQKYSFRYPNEWTAVTSKYAAADALFGKDATPTMGEGGVEVREINIEPQNFYKLTESKVIESSPYIVNGINGYKYTYSNIMVSHGFVFKNKDGLIYNIYINSEDDQNLKIFGQILSTFRFTE